MLALRGLSIAAAIALLASCGGGGGGGDSGPPASKLFVAASVTANPPRIGSLVNPDPAAGTLDTVDRLILGGNTSLAGDIGSLALDTQNDRLYVGNQVNIQVFNGASQADGNVPPARSMSMSGGNAASVFLDTVNDRLYIGDNVSSGVRVYNSASTQKNAPATDRFITGADAVLGVQVDTTKNILYVSTVAAGPVYTIRVYDSASTVDGAAAPNRTITPHINTTDQPVGAIFLDKANDRLYVAGGTNAQVMVFEGVSAKTGTVTPDKTLTFPFGALKTVVVDTTHDRLYALGAGVVFLLNNVSTVAAGAVTGKAAVAPAGVTFTGIAVAP